MATERTFLAIAVILGFLFDRPPAQATPIESTAFGHHLAGGTVTVNFQTGPAITAEIVGNRATQTGQALGTVGPLGIPVFFFNVTGDTFASTGTLANLTPGNFIRTVTFDLAGSPSLFDNDSDRSTFLSLVGVLGVTHTGGPAPSSSQELVPWPDVQNRGDMFLQERIIFPADLFGPTRAFEWRDDTDIIAMPEPATLALFSFGILLLLGATCTGPARGSSWQFSDIRAFFDKKTELQSTLQALVNHDLARKIHDLAVMPQNSPGRAQ